MVIVLSSAVAAAACAALLWWLLSTYTKLPAGWVLFFTFLVLLLVYAAAPTLRIGV